MQRICLALQSNPERNIADLVVKLLLASGGFAPDPCPGALPVDPTGGISLRPPPYAALEL